MPQHLIETAELIAETGRSLRAMEDAKRANEVSIELSSTALRQSHEVLVNASWALAGPYFREHRYD